MSQSRQRSIQFSIPARDLDDAVHDRLLGVLGDPACRGILHATTHCARTAAELGDELDLPLSTVYRKLDELTATPLIEETYRLPSDGKNSRQYRCLVDHIEVRLDGPDEAAGTDTDRTPGRR